jgi:hypothetical protein
MFGHLLILFIKEWQYILLGIAWSLFYKKFPNNKYFVPYSFSQSSDIDACFKQIWKTPDENALRKICQFYDIVRVDSEEKIKEEQKQ